MLSITKALSQEIITALFDDSGIIADFLFAKPAPKRKASHTGNKVTIPGFGTFSTRYRKERDGIHPAYNKNDKKWKVPNAADLNAKEIAKKEKDLNKKYPKGKIKIDATYVVSFKAGKGLKERAVRTRKSKQVIRLFDISKPLPVGLFGPCHILSATESYIVRKCTICGQIIVIFGRQKVFNRLNVNRCFMRCLCMHMKVLFVVI